MTTQKGVDNYRGRVGKTFFGDVFYDINLEVDQILPHTKSASEIKKSTSVNSLSQTSENVNNKFSEKIGKAEYENVKDNAALREDINDLKELVKRSNAIEAASITSQLKSLQKISDLWAQGVSNAMTEFEKTENKSVDSTVAYDVKSSSKTRYEEFRTNAMIWANSANTQVGDTKIFNNRGKSFVLVETTENGYIEVESGSYEYLKGVKSEYADSRRTEEKVVSGAKAFDKMVRDVRLGRRDSLWNYVYANNEGTSDGNAGLYGRHSNTDGAGNFEGISENSKSLPEKFSLKTNYLHEVALKNKKDTLPFKTEPRHESGLLSDNVSIYSLLNKLLNVNEGLKHPRKDNIVDFARGNLLLDILGNKYEADAVIGFTKYGMCELHDIVNMKPATFEYKKEASYKDSSSKKGLSQKGNASLITLYPQTQEKVKKIFIKYKLFT